MTGPILLPTPPMGWNSWNQFGPHVTEALLRETADAFISSGLRDAGYTFLVIDDHWHGGRDESGRLFPDPHKFPSGIKALADYVHSLGLKLGIYSDAGPKTCGGCPGSMDHEELDAQTFASWEVDYLKYDWCHAPDDRASAKRLYGKMGAALQKAGRPIVFSVCEWGHHRPWLWAPGVGAHLWRTTGDFGDAWEDVPTAWGALHGIDSIGFDQQRGLEAYAGPGHWNDPDMLVVGLYGQSQQIYGAGCTDLEYRTHFSLWCMLAAPLMIGCDVRAMNAPTRQILLNPGLIAVNQDPLGVQGCRVQRCGLAEVWAKPLAHGDLAVALFNRDVRRARATAHWSDLEIDGPYQAVDLWQGQSLGVLETSFSTELLPHGCQVLRLSKAI